MVNEIAFILILAAANFIQGITGFGGAPLAMSATIPLVGIDSAKPVVTLMFWFAPLITAIKNLKSINWKIFFIMLGFMAVGVVAGQLLYSYMPKNILMIVYGSIVIAVGAVKFFVKTEEALPKPWNYIALVFAGLMQGVLTSGGPFLVLYATGALKDKNEFRATCSAIWAVLNTYLTITMLIGGMFTAYEGTLAAATAIPVLAGAYFGGKLASKLNIKTFLKIVYGLLVVSGAILIMNAIIG